MMMMMMMMMALVCLGKFIPSKLQCNPGPTYLLPTLDDALNISGSAGIRRSGSGNSNGSNGSSNGPRRKSLNLNLSSSASATAGNFVVSVCPSRRDMYTPTQTYQPRDGHQTRVIHCNGSDSFCSTDCNCNGLGWITGITDM